MILYFSGTGNSAYTAQKIAENIQDDTLDLFQKIRDSDHTQICSDKPWVIVSPTYAWRIPRILQDWLTKTKLTGNKDIYSDMRREYRKCRCLYKKIVHLQKPEF